MGNLISKDNFNCNCISLIKNKIYNKFVRSNNDDLIINDYQTPHPLLGFT